MDEEKDNEEKNQVIEEGKSVAKKAIMKKVKPILIKIAIPVIVIIFAGAMLLGIFNEVGKAVQSIVDSIVDFFTIDSDGAIIVSDEQVDTIINAIDELGVSIDGLKLMGDVDYNNPDIQEENTKALRKYIKEFFEAQAMTETINTNPGWFEEHITNGGKPYGTVYVHRVSGDEVVKNTDDNQLTYISYDDMKKKKESGDKNITKYYSIDEEGKLVIAGWAETQVIKNGQASSKETQITLKHINYKDVVSQYTTEMTFLLYLTMITQNPEFVSKVTELVKQSDIRLTVLDSKSTTVTTETYTYTERTKTRKEVEEGVFEETTDDSEPITEVTKTTTTRLYPIIQVTYAKTWFSEQTITYNKTDEPGSTVDAEGEPIEDEEEPEIDGEGEGSVTWKVNQTEKYSYTTSGTSYTEGTRGNVIDKTGEKGDGEESFIGLLDVEFKIPNSTRYVAAGGNLVSGAEMFFYLLQQNSSSQNMEQIMRYILYKYTGRDYGVTEFDFSIFDARSFQEATNTQGLSKYLLQFSHGSGAARSADGQYYLMYGDGVGWPTIGDADLQWKSNQSKFAVPGKVLENGAEKDVLNVQEYVNSKLKKGADAKYTNAEVAELQIYIEVDLVDQIGSQVQQAVYNVALNATNGLDLSKQQLYALTAIIYNFGSLPERNGYTFREVYNAGAEKYEINSWEHNKFIWDNWWCALGGGEAGHIPARDAAFETYVKGVFDFSLSDAGEVFGRQYYIYYTEKQLAAFSYAPSKAITRTTENEEEIFTMEIMAGEFTPANEKYIVGYYTSTTGRTFTILNQNTIRYENREYWRLNDPPDGPGWAGRCNRAACAIIASGYSSQDPNELITTMNKMYDGVVPSNKYWSLYGLEKTAQGGSVSAGKFVEMIREQLTEGGYVAVWVNSNNKGYYGKSGTRWTKNIHWMAIIDYRVKDGEEQIVIADARGADWYDIDEYINGVSAYALINEK